MHVPLRNVSTFSDPSMKTPEEYLGYIEHPDPRQIDLNQTAANRMANAKEIPEKGDKPRKKSSKQKRKKQKKTKKRKAPSISSRTVAPSGNTPIPLYESPKHPKVVAGPRKKPTTASELGTPKMEQASPKALNLLVEPLNWGDGKDKANIPLAVSCPIFWKEVKEMLTNNTCLPDVVAREDFLTLRLKYSEFHPSTTLKLRSTMMKCIHRLEALELMVWKKQEKQWFVGSGDASPAPGSNSNGFQPVAAWGADTDGFRYNQLCPIVWGDIVKIMVSLQEDVNGEAFIPMVVSDNVFASFRRKHKELESPNTIRACVLRLKKQEMLHHNQEEKTLGEDVTVVEYGPGERGEYFTKFLSQLLMRAKQLNAKPPMPKRNDVVTSLFTPSTCISDIQLDCTLASAPGNNGSTYRYYRRKDLDLPLKGLDDKTYIAGGITVKSSSITKIIPVLVGKGGTCKRMSLLDTAATGAPVPKPHWEDRYRKICQTMQYEYHPPLFSYTEWTMFEGKHWELFEQQQMVRNNPGAVQQMKMCGHLQGHLRHKGWDDCHGGTCTHACCQATYANYAKLNKEDSPPKRSGSKNKRKAAGNATKTKSRKKSKSNYV